ncbi:MAG: TlpA disulfide reductase family protein [Actinobacteria bacterium]|nr:TlpA disulfide reductase family protein [Actinomycetota bacterium]
MKSQNLVKIVSSVVGIVVAMFFVVLVVSDPDQDIVAKSPLLGQPAPAVASETIDGNQFVLERRKGSWVVLNFFNSTCVPCINEHDLLVEFANSEAMNSNAAEIYTVINDDSSDAVRDFFDKNGGDWPKIKDDNGAIAVAFGVARVPETWIIDPNGLVRLRITGELSPDLLSDQVNKLRDEFTS